MRYRVLPYLQGSKSAKALATALGGKVLKLVGSTFVWTGNDVVINWGNTNPPIIAGDGKALNDPAVVKNASNKLKFFQLMKEAGHDAIIPKFWTSASEIPAESFPIVCRTVLAGHSGDGIVIAASPDDLVQCPLYVQYVKKQDEYRVHVGIKNDEPTVIAVQKKARRLDVENPNWQIRNHHNGFIYKREGVNPPTAVLDAASKALVASGLNFGAVDVIFNAQTQKAYVLEINTAPGLEGQTVTDYANFFNTL
jgi:glutathione synthase/RimK-type ligase-like ATP-grasp enzyme